MQLRAEGKLDLEDPLERHLPEASQHGSLTLGEMLAHASGLQREPPGEIWESLAFPDAAELLARLPEAERVLPPAARRGTTRTSPTRCSARSSSASRARRSGTYVEERLLAPLGLARTTWGPTRPAASRTSSSRTPRRSGASRSSSSEARAASRACPARSADLARWGSFLCDPDETILPAALAEEMHVVRIMARPDWTRGWGRGLELWRRGERILAGHTGGFPGFLSMLVYSRPDRIGAVLLTNSGNWDELGDTGLRLVEAALDELAPRPIRGRRRSRRRPRSSRCSGAGGRRAPSRSSAGAAGGSRRGWRTRRRIASRRCSSPRATTATARSGPERGEVLRVVRGEDGEIEKLYWATYPFTRDPKTFGAGGHA